jgi:acetoin utilization deacetylase AcuC-like enzyme
LLTFYNEQHAQQFGATDNRIRTVQAELERRGLGEIVTPQSVPLTALERTHSPRYLAFLRNAWREAQPLAAGAPSVTPRQLAVRTMRTDIEPDDFFARLGLYAMDTVTGIGAGTWSAAKAGADCAVNAAHALRVGERASFVLTQPQGHHAGADFCGGHCYLNHAALADYQHGNGAQGIFYERADVLCMSIHADPRQAFPFYCGHADETGAGAGLGYNVNLPLAPGSNAQAWFAALETACVRLSMYRPEALVVALGGNIFQGEPHGGFGLATADFLRLGERLAWLGVPATFQLEGGSPLRELGTNIVNVLEGFDCALV